MTIAPDIQICLIDVRTNGELPMELIEIASHSQSTDIAVLDRDIYQFTICVRNFNMLDALTFAVNAVNEILTEVKSEFSIITLGAARAVDISGEPHSHCSVCRKAIPLGAGKCVNCGMEDMLDD